eukprot:jgi/Mesvir1/27292/Mv07125-RA.1
MTATAKPAAVAPAVLTATPTRMRTRTAGTTATASPSVIPSDAPPPPPPSSTAAPAALQGPTSCAPPANAATAPNDASALPAPAGGAVTSNGGPVVVMNGNDHSPSSPDPTKTAAHPDSGKGIEATAVPGAHPGDLTKPAPVAVKLEHPEGTGGAACLAETPIPPVVAAIPAKEGLPAPTLGASSACVADHCTGGVPALPSTVDGSGLLVTSAAPHGAASEILAPAVGNGLSPPAATGPGEASSSVPAVHNNEVMHGLSLPQGVVSPSLMLPAGVLEGGLNVTLDGTALSPTMAALGSITLDHGHPHEDHHLHPHGEPHPDAAGGEGHAGGLAAAHTMVLGDPHPLEDGALELGMSVDAAHDHGLHSDPLAGQSDPLAGHSDHHVLGNGHGVEGDHMVTDDGFHHVVGLSLDHVDLDMTLGHMGVELDVARGLAAHDSAGGMATGDVASGSTVVKEEFLPGCMVLDGLPVMVKQQHLHGDDVGDSHLALGLDADLASVADPLHPPVSTDPLHPSNGDTDAKLKAEPAVASHPGGGMAVGAAPAGPPLQPGVAPLTASQPPTMQAPPPPGQAQPSSQGQAQLQGSQQQAQQQQRPRPLLPSPAKPAAPNQPPQQGQAPGADGTLATPGAPAAAKGGMTPVSQDHALVGAGGAPAASIANAMPGGNQNGPAIVAGGLSSAAPVNDNSSNSVVGANGGVNGCATRPMPVEWTAEEQKILDDTLQALAVKGSPNGSVGSSTNGGGAVPASTLVERYLLVAEKLPNKSVRDVAYRCRWLAKQREANKRKNMGEDANAVRKVASKKPLHPQDGGPMGSGGAMAMVLMQNQGEGEGSLSICEVHVLCLQESLLGCQCRVKVSSSS